MGLKEGLYNSEKWEKKVKQITQLHHPKSITVSSLIHFSSALFPPAYLDVLIHPTQYE